MIKFLLGRIPVLFMHGYRILTKFTSHLYKRKCDEFESFYLLAVGVNPTDIVSRGFLLTDLVKNEVWFKGPNFLTSTESVGHTLQLVIHLILILVKKKNVGCNLVYNKDSKACVQSIDVLPIFNNRSSHQRCSMKKGALRNFAKFTRKGLCQSLFFNKVAGLRPCLRGFLRDSVDISKVIIAERFGARLHETRIELKPV